MSYYDNPANRLLDIVKKIQGIANDTSCRVAWRDILENDNLDDSEILLSINKVIELISQVTDYFKAHDPDYLQDCENWINQIIPALGKSMQLNNRWEGVKDCMDNHTLGYLRFATRIINSNFNQKQINALQELNSDSLREISSKIKELYEEVFQAEIDEKIKLSVLKYLSRLIEAIDNYAITGSENVLDAIEAALGHMLLNPEYRNFMAENPSGQRIMQKMGDIATMLTVTTGLISIAKDFVNLLPK